MLFSRSLLPWLRMNRAFRSQWWCGYLRNTVTTLVLSICYSHTSSGTIRGTEMNYVGDGDGGGADDYDSGMDIMDDN